MPFGGDFHHAPKALFTVAQCPFGALLFSHILHERHHAADHPVRPAVRYVIQMDVVFAIRVADIVVEFYLFAGKCAVQALPTRSKPASPNTSATRCPSKSNGGRWNHSP